MIRRQGRVHIAEPSRHLQRLCFHFSRKIEVRYDEHQGEAAFPWGHCAMRADGETLHFDCSAADAASLERVQYAIDSHVELFSRKSPVQVAWEVIEVMPSPP